MPSIAGTAAKIAKEGQFVTLRRTGQSDLTLKAFIRGYQVEELTEGIIQGDRVAMVSNAEIAKAGWPGPPKREDQIVIGGKTTLIQSCETLTFRGEIERHVMQLRGG